MVTRAWLRNTRLEPFWLRCFRNAAWTISNFCRGKPQPPIALIQEAVGPLAAVVQRGADTESVTDATWALSYFSDGEGDRVDRILATGVLPMLVANLSHANASISLPSLRTVGKCKRSAPTASVDMLPGNIVTGSDVQTQAVVDAGAIPHMGRLLHAAKESVSVIHVRASRQL